jgi:hypothetical protein
VPVPDLSFSHPDSQESQTLRAANYIEKKREQLASDFLRTKYGTQVSDLDLSVLEPQVDRERDLQLFHDAQLAAFDTYQHELKATQARMEREGVPNYEPPGEVAQTRFRELFAKEMLKGQGEDLEHLDRERLRIATFLAQDRHKAYDTLTEDQKLILKSLLNLPAGLDKESFAKHTFHKFQSLLNENLEKEK